VTKLQCARRIFKSIPKYIYFLKENTVILAKTMFVFYSVIVSCRLHPGEEKRMYLISKHHN